MRILVLTPIRDRLSFETDLALSRNMDGLDWEHITVTGLPVDEARNALWARARAVSHFSHVLWVDADAWWAPGTITTLLQALETSPHSVIGGAYCLRAPLTGYVGYSRIKWPPEPFGHHKGKWLRFPQQALVPVQGVGCHAFAHHASLLHELPNDPFTVRRLETEETGFARCVGAAGKTMAVCIAATFGHVETATGQVFFPHQPASLIVANRSVVTDTRPREEQEANYLHRFFIRTYGPRVDETAAAAQRWLAMQRSNERWGA